MSYTCTNCKSPPKSKFGGILPIIIIDSIIVFILIVWCCLIKIWNYEKEQPIISIESDIVFNSPEDKLIMTKSSNNRKYMLKINSNRMASRPSTIFTVHQNKYNALELNTS